MRMSILLCALASLPGCTTVTYTSSRPRLEVAECIASGWRNAAPSGYGVPVSRTDFADYCFVGVELHANFSPLPTGTGHPTYAVWAEVRDTPSGRRRNITGPIRSSTHASIVSSWNARLSRTERGHRTLRP
jgi:hypothetical protein